MPNSERKNQLDNHINSKRLQNIISTLFNPGPSQPSIIKRNLTQSYSKTPKRVQPTNSHLILPALNTTTPKNQCSVPSLSLEKNSINRSHYLCSDALKSPNSRGDLKESRGLSNRIKEVIAAKLGINVEGTIESCILDNFESKEKDLERRADKTFEGFKPNQIHEKKTEFLAAYRPLDPQLFQQIKTLEDCQYIRYKNALYYGQMPAMVRNGKGTMIHNNGKIYEGEWLNGQKSGKGTEKLPKGHFYTGQFLNGKPHGQGVFKSEDGDVYEGEFVNGLKQGKGTWKSNSGMFYIGEWNQGRAEGCGKHIGENGNKYQGEFKDSMKHGRGTEEFANGDKYVGEFKDGEPSGYGEYSWTQGSTYRGDFKNGIMEGKGIYSNIQGDKYEGSYKGGKKEGYGEYFWVSGSVYKGNFQNDLREGYGEMYWPDTSVYKGQWIKGIQHGTGELLLSGKSALKGNFVDNIFFEEINLKPVLLLPELNKGIFGSQSKRRQAQTSKKVRGLRIVNIVASKNSSQNYSQAQINSD